MDGRVLSTLLLIIGAIGIAKGVITYSVCKKRFSRRLTIALTVGVPVGTLLIVFLIIKLILKV